MTKPTGDDKFHAYAPERAFLHANRHLQPADLKTTTATQCRVPLLHRAALRYYAYLMFGHAHWLCRRRYVLPDGRPTCEVFFWAKRLKHDIQPNAKLGQFLNQLDWMREKGFFHSLEFRDSAYIRNHNSEWGPIRNRLLARAVLEPFVDWGTEPGEIELNLAREAGLPWAIPPDAVPVPGKLWKRVASKRQLAEAPSGIEIAKPGDWTQRD